MRWTKRAVSVVVLCAALACGGDPGPDDGGGGGGTSGNITAQVDGTDWESAVTSEDAGVGPLGVITIQGTYASTQSITIILSNIDEPGTYPLGVNSSNVGGLAVFSTSTGQSWFTPGSGAAGTIALTTLTQGRIAGTFSFNAIPQGGGATGIKVVTNGAFDLLLAGTLATLPDNQGSLTSGTVDGSPWTAATSLMTLSSGTLVVNVSNTSYIIGVIVTGFTAPGSFTVGTPGQAAVSAAVSTTSGGPTWAFGTGTFTVSSLTATRIRGTLSATIQPGAGSGASAPLVLDDLAYDIGRPETPTGVRVCPSAARARGVP